MLQPIERVNNSYNENNFQDADDYLEASFNAPEQRISEQPEHYTSNLNDAEIDRLSSLSDDEIYDWDVPEDALKLTSDNESKFLHGKNVKQTSDFGYINWSALCELVKAPKSGSYATPEQAKANSEVLAATDCITKQKADVLDHNNFTLLRLDLDDTEQTMDAIKANLLDNGFTSFIIHTTAKHNQVDIETGEFYGTRYRVYIEIAESIPFVVWSTLETYLNFVFNGDDCADRPQQIMYLPTMFNGIKYDHHIEIGKPLDLEVGDLLERADAHCIAMAKEQATMTKRLLVLKHKKQKPENLLTGQISIIEAVNEAYTWESLLTNYGYKRQGGAWLPPESTSGTAGVYILTSQNGRERYYSHHASDMCNTGIHCLDQFDFICIREFNGNEYEALLSMGKEFPEITKHNQSVWRTVKGGL